MKNVFPALAAIGFFSCSKPSAQPASAAPISAEPSGPEAERQALARHLADAVRDGAKPRDPGADPGRMGLIGLLNTGAGGDPDAPTAPWGRDDTGGVGNAWGDEIGNSFGAGGFGLGEVGSGSNSGKGKPQLRAGALSVSGGLPPEVIARIVRQNFGRFRLCYGEGLKTDPKLQGTVTVQFTIKEDGSIGDISGGGSLPSKDVIACITKSFGDISFPSPEKGTVKVTYPLALSPPETTGKDGAGAPPR